MSAIEQVVGREVLDRGEPDRGGRGGPRDGARGRAIVPSGASTGQFEAVELRDGGDRYAGKGVATTVANVNGPIAELVEGLEALEQRELDRTLIDATARPTRATSAPTPSSGCRWPPPRPADELEVPALPLRRRGQRPRAAGADDERAQRRRATPTTTSTCRSSCSCRWRPSFTEALRWGTETYHVLKKVLHDRGLSTAVGDEGGFAPGPGLQREPCRC